MISVIIITFMTAGLLVFTSMIQKMQYEYGTSIRLSNQARMAMEKIIWGTHVAATPDRHGIWEAQAYDIVSPTQFTYTDMNGAVHGIRLNGLKVETQAAAGLPWVSVLDLKGDATKDSLALNFTETRPNVVQIRMVLGERVIGRWQYASLSTQVDVRNV